MTNPKDPKTERSLLRCQEPGWQLISMPDPARRRGLWMRTTPSASSEGELDRVELCSGREGDDYYVSLSIRENVPRPALRALERLLNHYQGLVSFFETEREAARAAAARPASATSEADEFELDEETIRRLAKLADYDCPDCDNGARFCTRRCMLARKSADMISRRTPVRRKRSEGSAVKWYPGVEHPDVTVDVVGWKHPVGTTQRRFWLKPGTTGTAPHELSPGTWIVTLESGSFAFESDEEFWSVFERAEGR